MLKPAALLNAHQALPLPLRVWALVAITVVLVVIGGVFFTLPSGPLCDEGMVLFMEGGCDWGRSNEFFFAKLGLLLGMNVAFCIAWRHRLTASLGFVPHFLILGVLAIYLRSDPDCDRYYSHPNGSTGQMIVEAMGFAAFGLGLLRRFAASPRRALGIPVLLAWNASHIAVFYVGLFFTHHWTWLHTGWITGALLVAALAAA